MNIALQTRPQFKCTTKHPRPTNPQGKTDHVTLYNTYLTCYTHTTHSTGVLWLHFRLLCLLTSLYPLQQRKQHKLHQSSHSIQLYFTTRFLLLDSATKKKNFRPKIWANTYPSPLHFYVTYLPLSASSKRRRHGPILSRKTLGFKKFINSIGAVQISDLENRKGAAKIHSHSCIFLLTPSLLYMYFGLENFSFLVCL